MIAGSGLYDAEDWDFADTTSDADTAQDATGGTKVQAVMRLGNYAALYKERSISLLNYVQAAEATYSRQGLTEEWGACSPFSMCDIGGSRHVAMARENFLLVTPAGVTQIGDRVWQWLIDADLGKFQEPFRDRVWCVRNRIKSESIFVYPTSALVPQTTGGTLPPGAVGMPAKPVPFPQWAQTAIVYHEKHDAWSTRDWWNYSAAATVRIPTRMTIGDHTEKIGDWARPIGDTDSDIGDRFVAGTDFGEVYAVEDTVAGAGTVATLETGDDFFEDPNAIKEQSGLVIQGSWSGTTSPQVYVSARMRANETVTWKGPYTINWKGMASFHCKGKFFRYKFVKTGGAFKLYAFAPFIKKCGWSR
jgi:hypothetical protein